MPNIWWCNGALWFPAIFKPDCVAGGLAGEGGDLLGDEGKGRHFLRDFSSRFKNPYQLARCSFCN